MKCWLQGKAFQKCFWPYFGFYLENIHVSFLGEALWVMSYLVEGSGLITGSPTDALMISTHF